MVEAVVSVWSDWALLGKAAAQHRRRTDRVVFMAFLCFGKISRSHFYSGNDISVRLFITMLSGRAGRACLVAALLEAPTVLSPVSVLANRWFSVLR